jgi:imidazolonepropionase-like amidohydrolase
MRLPSRHGTRRTALTAATALTALTAAPAAAQTVTAFEHVTVIPMDRERVLENQTVVIRDGRVAALGPAGSVPVPAGAVRVAAAGKYLIPGLAEMHAHIPGPGAAGTSGASYQGNVLFLYVAAGVTTVRGMLGQPSHLDLRRRVEAGELVGPRIWTSGPSVNGNTVQTPAAAVAAVQAQYAAGYDFIKIHPGLEREVFDSLDAAADRVGMRYAGHVPVAVGIERALEAGYWSVDHLDGYVEHLAGHSGQPALWFGARLGPAVDPARIPEIARRTREAGVWNVPTQTLMESFATPESAEQLARRPELRYIPRAELQRWITWKVESADGQHIPRADLDAWITARRRLIKALHDAGAGLLLGSDAPQVWNVPGFSVHRELEAMVAAGLTPFEALATGTRNVAAYLGTEDRAGTIAVGMQADFILLDANPLTDIRHTTRRAGVMVRGVWHPQAEIEARLEEIARAYAGSSDGNDGMNGDHRM